MYGSETWRVTKKMAKKLNAAHTAMESKMLDVKWQDHITNETIKQKTKIPDLMDRILRLKWKWAGHIARMTDNWANDLTMWHPSSKRKPGRPRKRWAEEIKKSHGHNWHKIATDREKWSSMEEAFIQQWRTTGCMTMMMNCRNLDHSPIQCLIGYS